MNGSNTGAMADFERYSRDALHFFSLDVPELLRQTIDGAGDRFTLVDLGCGDGNLVHALREAGLLERAAEVMGVDLSPERIERFEANTGCRGIVSGVQDVAAIADASVDTTVCTMVIEHVPDDGVLMREIGRQLKVGGRVYLTTVFKKRGAWYFRRSPDGRWVLDATHVREYDSPDAVRQLVLGAGLEIERERISRLRPPPLHPMLRMVNRVIRLRGVNKIFLKGGPLAWLERITVPIPRYRMIELVARRVA